MANKHIKLSEEPRIEASSSNFSQSKKGVISLEDEKKDNDTASVYSANAEEPIDMSTVSIIYASLCSLVVQDDCIETKLSSKVDVRRQLYH